MTYTKQLDIYNNRKKRLRSLALAMSQNQGAIKEVLFKLFKKS